MEHYPKAPQFSLFNRYCIFKKTDKKPILASPIWSTLYTEITEQSFIIFGKNFEQKGEENEKRIEIIIN